MGEEEAPAPVAGEAEGDSTTNSQAAGPSVQGICSALAQFFPLPGLCSCSIRRFDLFTVLFTETFVGFVICLQKREEDPENYYRAGFLLFHSCGTMAILIQVIAPVRIDICMCNVAELEATSLLRDLSV